MINNITFAKLYNGTNYVITITDNDRMSNTIDIRIPNVVSLSMPIGIVKTDVVKINKSRISTCNAEMFAYLLSHDDSIFYAVMTHVFNYTNNDYVGTHVTLSQFYNRFNADLDSFISLFESVSYKTRRKIIADHVCYNHEAKMHGVISMSTYVGANQFCKARCSNCDNAICKYCYANSLTNQRAGLRNKLQRIHAIMTTIELSPMDIPMFDSSVYPYFRFESFGDINNVVQVRNYNMIAFFNHDINFTLWTKNPGIIQAAVNNGMKLSDNLVIGLSSLYLNTPELEKARRYSFIRFLFTVYDDEYIAEHKIVINCGAKHCLSCGICYKALHENRNTGLVIINERKK